MAVSGVCSEYMQQKLNADFRRMPIHNAAMENVFRDLTPMNLASYSCKQMSAVVRQQLHQKHTVKWTVTDAQMAAHRASVRAEKARTPAVQPQTRSQVVLAKRQATARAKLRLPTTVDFNNPAFCAMQVQMESCPMFEQGKARDELGMTVPFEEDAIPKLFLDLFQLTDRLGAGVGVAESRAQFTAARRAERHQKLQLKRGKAAMGPVMSSDAIIRGLMDRVAVATQAAPATQTHVNGLGKRKHPIQGSLE